MIDSKTDKKHIQLLRLIAQLRDHIDIYRIIGLNIGALKGSQISDAFIGYLQKSALESLAIYICKIFESSGRNDLNSILGIIESIPVATATEVQSRELAAFGRKYGHCSAPTDVRSYLDDTFGLFQAAHTESLKRLKEFRDKIGAHSDYHAEITSLPSYAEFEALFNFAKEFYEVVSHSIIGVGPAVIPGAVGGGFFRLIASLGVQNPIFDFEVEE